MREYMDFDTTPSGEKCAQVGSKIYDDNFLSKIEARILLSQLKRQFGEFPQTVRTSIKSCPHDFGNYLQLRFSYDDNSESATEFVYTVEAGWPESWDEISKQELEKENYFELLAGK